MKQLFGQLQWAGLLTNPRLVATVTAALGVWAAFAAADLTWHLVPLPEGDEAGLAADDADPATPAARAARKRLNEVAALHLFGEQKAEAPPSAKRQEVAAPETPLNLSLKGVFVHSEAQRAFAIISAPGAADKPYRVGDGLPGGAKLSEIYADHVLLDRNRRFETLRLPQGKSTGAPAGRAGPAPIPGGRGPVPTARAPMPAPPPEPDDAAGEDEMDVGARLREYRQKLLARPGEAAQLARMQPVMEGGTLKGYKLTPGKDPALFQQVGLQAGDVVTSVNGITLDNPAELGRVIDQLSNAEQLELMVENGGQSRPVHLDFAE